MTTEVEPTLATGSDSTLFISEDPTRIELTDADAGRTGRPRRGRYAGRHRRPRSFLREVPLFLLCGLVLVVLVKAFVVQAFYIPSGSMETTLLCNDRVLVNRLAYVVGEPARGDVIVFRNWEDVGEDVPSASVLTYVGRSLREAVPWPDRGGRSEDLIKRVIALPGETVEVRAVGAGDEARSIAVVDGTPLAEPYVFSDGHDPLSPFGPVVVPAGKYFVLGDHRNDSLDSRREADGLLVDMDAVVGKAFVRVWPPSRLGALRGPGGGPPALRPAAGRCVPGAG